MSTELGEVLAELRVLTKSCYEIKIELAVLAENHRAFKEAAEVQYAMLRKAISDLRPPEKQRHTGMKKILDTLVEYRFSLLAGIACLGPLGTYFHDVSRVVA